MTKRLLYLTAEEWPTFRVDLTVLFGRELPKHGLAIDLVTEPKGNAPPPPWPAGALQLAAPRGSKVATVLGKFWHQCKAAWQASPATCDAIQVRDMPIVATVALLAARARGLKFFYWMSFPQSEGQIDRARQRGMKAGLRYWAPMLQGQLGKWLLYHWVMPRADHVFVQSHQMAKDVAAEGIDPAKLTPVLMATTPEATNPELIQPATDPTLQGRKVVVYLGTLDRARQIEILIEAMARVHAKHPEVLLVLVGDADAEDHRAHLRELISQARYQPVVHWTGWVPMDQAWSYVRAADLAVSPFPRGFLLDSASPTKAVEYLAMGVPVVVNDNPDQQKLVQDSGAGLCVPYTADDFARAIDHMLSLPAQDKAAMGAKGRAHVCAHRNYTHLGRDLAQVYHRLLA